MGLTMNFERPKIGIVGGTGRMGSWFAGLFEQLGSEVFRVGRKTDLTPAEMARRCDVTVISVPIEDTVRIIHEIGPLIPENGLLMDLTSIKKGPMEAMLKYSRGGVVGVHPLFGPDTVSPNQKLQVVVCPGRGKQWLDWITDIFQKADFRVIILTPEEHDHIMGIVQGVNHFSTLVLALCISRSGIELEHLVQCSTQTFKQSLDRIKSIVEQPEGLFGSLLMDNSDAGKFIEQYFESANKLIRIIRSKDRESLKVLFESLKGFFSKEVMEQ